MADYRVQEVIISYVIWLRNQYDNVYVKWVQQCNFDTPNNECYGSYLRYAFKEFVKVCESVVVSKGVCGVRTGEIARLGRRGDVEEILQQRWSRMAVADRPVRMDEEVEEDEGGWVRYGDEEDDQGGGEVKQANVSTNPKHWPQDHMPLTGEWMVGGMIKERKEKEPWSLRIAHQHLGSLEYERSKNAGRDTVGLDVPKTLSEKAEDIMDGRKFDLEDLDFATFTHLTTLPLNLPNMKATQAILKPRLERVLSYLKTGEAWTVVDMLDAEWNDVIEWRLQGIYDHYKGGKVQRYREWRTARGRVLCQAAGGVEGGDVNTARVLLTIVGREIIKAVEDGFKDVVKTLTNAADGVLEWGDGGESWGEAYNSFFDVVGGISTENVNDLTLKMWREDKERLMFETQEVERDSEDFRFTPGVMVKRRSKVDDVFDTPMIQGKAKRSLLGDSAGEDRIVKIAGAPLEWRMALCEALEDRATDVGFSRYRGHFGSKPVSFKSSIVTLPMDGVKVTVKSDGEVVELEVASACGFEIDGIRVKITVADKESPATVDVGVVDIYKVKETVDRRYLLPPTLFGSFDVVTELAVFHDVYSPGMLIHTENVEVEFWRRLRPCKLTDWCRGGDGDGFRSAWSAMSEAVRWTLKKTTERDAEGNTDKNWEALEYSEVDLDRFRIASDDRSSVVSLQEPMVKVTGWAFTTTLSGARILAVLTKTITSSKLELRCNRKDVAQTWFGENIRDGLAKWLTRGVWGVEGVEEEDFSWGTSRMSF